MLKAMFTLQQAEYLGRGTLRVCVVDLHTWGLLGPYKWNYYISRMMIRRRATPPEPQPRMLNAQVIPKTKASKPKFPKYPGRPRKPLNP